MSKKGLLTAIALAVSAGIPEAEIGSVLRESGFTWDQERDDVVDSEIHMNEEPSARC